MTTTAMQQLNTGDILRSKRYSRRYRVRVLAVRRGEVVAHCDPIDGGKPRTLPAHDVTRV